MASPSRRAATSAAIAASTPCRPAADALHLHRRLDAGEAAEDHRLVHVAEVADAKDAARERAEPAGDRDLEALARDRAQRLGIDPGRDLDRRHRHRARLRHLREEAQRAAFAPARHGGVDGARQAGVARLHVRQAFAFDQAERGLEAGEVGERRRAAELAIRELAAPALPVPVEARRRVGGGDGQRALVGGDEGQARVDHQAFLRRADRDVDAERVHRERRGGERGDDVDDEERRDAAPRRSRRGSRPGRRSCRWRCRCGRRRPRRCDAPCRRAAPPRSPPDRSESLRGKACARRRRRTPRTCSAQPSEKWPVPGTSTAAPGATRLAITASQPPWPLAA